MAQQIINTGANANDGTGEPLREAFTAVNENFTEIYTAGPVGTNVKISGNTITTTVTNQNLVIQANGVGDIQSNSTIVPGTPGVYDLGSSDSPFAYVHGQYFVGNGALITGISVSGGTKIENGTSYVDVTSPGGNVSVGVGATGNVAVFASSGMYVTGNIIPSSNATYSLGNASNQWKSLYVSNSTVYIANVALNVTGNTLQVDGANVITSVGNSISVTGNVTGGNVLTGGILSAGGNVSGNYFIGNGSQLTGISGGGGGGANIANGTSNVTVVSSGGNVSVGVGGTGNVAVFSTTGEYITGVVSASGNITGGNVLTGGVISSTGTITGSSHLGTVISVTGNVTGNYVSGNGTQLTGVLADRGNDTNNWNTLTTMGIYTVNRTSWSGTVGTPLDSQVYVGMLEVKNSTNTAIEQIFYPGTVESGDEKIQWNRSNWANTWTQWIKIVNDYQIVYAGDF